MSKSPIRTFVVAAAIVAVALSVSVIATRYNDDDFTPTTERSWFDSFTHGLSWLNPFGSKLGHDWSETQEKVENIYRDAHHKAQMRAMKLKEEALSDHTELRDKIAQIYKEGAEEAEERIERLQRPILHWLHRTEEHHDEPGMMDRAKDYVKSKFSPKQQQSMWQDTTTKLKKGYKEALAAAEAAVEKVPKGASETLTDAKKRFQSAYDEALHRYHGDTRTRLGQFRDMLGHGMHRAADMGKSAAMMGWHVVLHAIAGVFWMILGGVIATSLMYFFTRRQFDKQLNSSNVGGPVTLTQVWKVLGDEEKQRKFLEYWNSVSNSYFARQNGLKKASLHRSIGDTPTSWFAISEWSSVDDLRKAFNTPEFKDIKKRIPVTAVPAQTLYQMNAVGAVRSDDTSTLPKTYDASGLRQRGTGVAMGPGTT